MTTRSGVVDFLQQEGARPHQRQCAKSLVSQDVSPGTPILEIPDVLVLGHYDHVAVTKAEREKAAELIQGLLDMIDDGDLAADGPASVAPMRRLAVRPP